MKWLRPLDYLIVPTDDHPGAYGVQRKYEIHTGVDLYAPEGTPIRSVEDGRVVAIEWFTGPDADPPCPWWLPTKAVLVEGPSGVVLYGEVSPLIEEGDIVDRGQIIAMVKRVIRNDKGRPTSMLHLELHRRGTTKSTHPWTVLHECPESLMDPTYLLIEAE